MKIIKFPLHFSEVQERIQQINPVKYSNTRNYIDGSVSYLSPYISSKKPEVTSSMKHLNKPEYLVEVAKDVAKYRNQSYDYICEITYQNYLNFFGIKE